MDSFDQIEIRRPALARECLALLASNDGRPLALSAPQQVGKTYFLEHDFIPEAKLHGLIPVYVDFGLEQADPIGALTGPLEVALDTPHHGKIVLLLDEVQELRDTEQGMALIANLRSVLKNRPEDLCAIFTGSSQAGLLQLMSTLETASEPFAQFIDFPVLGDDFLRALADRFEALHPEKKLAMAELRAAFKKAGGKPATLRNVVKTMAAQGTVDFNAGFDLYLANDAQVGIWIDLLKSMTSFDRAVLITIAQGQPPLSPQTLKSLEAIPGAKPSVEKVRTSIGKLKRAGILALGSGPTIEDSLFANYLSKLALNDRAN